MKNKINSVDITLEDLEHMGLLVAELDLIVSTYRYKIKELNEELENTCCNENNIIDLKKYFEIKGSTYNGKSTSTNATTKTT